MTEPPDVEHSAVAQAGPTLVQIAGRVLNRPLLLHPDKADLILHVLQGRIGIEPLRLRTRNRTALSAVTAAIMAASVQCALQTASPSCRSWAAW